jgi:DNA-binding Lrp family transcriptional regulator
MKTAYMLFNTEIGAEKKVLSALKKVEGVQEAHSLWGVYDIIATITASDVAELKSIITKEIKKINKINSKLTMIIEEKPRIYSYEQLMFEDAIVI